MKSKYSLPKCLLTIAGIFLLIFDSQTALTAAQDAVVLCLYTVIPSLFPFIFLSLLLNNLLLGKKISILRPLGRLCGVPAGAESLLLLGLIGGYPVGAQATAEAYRSGSISKKTYRHLLGFCNNAGPAFIFGLVASQFTGSIIPWIIWAIHIASAITVGLTLSVGNEPLCNIQKKDEITFPQALNSAIQIMAKICGWVLLFRVLIAFLLHLLPQDIPKSIFGFFELTNGCVNLSTIPSEGIRFIAAVCILNFGGLCVAMQTCSVCEKFGTGLYFPGKLLQTFVGLVLSVAVVPFLFSQNLTVQTAVLPAAAAFIMTFVVYGTKKWWQFRQESYIMNLVH